MNPKIYSESARPLHQQLTANRFIYVKQNMQECNHNVLNASQKVLVNPHFKMSKVYINPNFSSCANQNVTCENSLIHVNPRLDTVNLMVLSENSSIATCSNQSKNIPNIPLPNTKIHINPNIRNVQLPINVSKTTSQTVHVNPNFKNIISHSNILNNVLMTTNNLQDITKFDLKEKLPSVKLNNTVVLTRTKLIRAPLDESKKLKRRNSVKSKFKIIKSGYKISQDKYNCSSMASTSMSNNQFKTDHRRRKSLSIVAKSHKKYVYVNRFVSASDIAKNIVIKKSVTSPLKSTYNCGIMCKRSSNSLTRLSVSSACSIKRSGKGLLKSEYKLVRKPFVTKQGIEKAGKLKNKRKVAERGFVIRKFKIVRTQGMKKNNTIKSPTRKLRKCNIPCPYYKKYGMCKGNENGKCFRKHDPDQIALCTRFLQGACIKENCLLSHNVSPEKMPTCKYYLEGSCSRENCPYLHVKISPKAEVCRNFLEGFCRKAAECTKRHQYLCPDYEKHGTCSKQRCQYPHGKMVRNYMVNKNKFVKNNPEKVLSKKVNESSEETRKGTPSKDEKAKDKQRYYVEENLKTEGYIKNKNFSGGDILQNKVTDFESNNKNYENHSEKTVGLKDRPKLGALPSFIPFGEL